ncbi:GNAT family N-acetyltransferase [Natrialba sp. PRR66]|uniref:GNAT family N-acetyltransferase n=1 Tax=Natrialba sp. PRR66 TaxID=3098146 RepID=UPI002B1E7C74|nr:GNAT family N-acetyltransferase [Natrialba sp. PRR66]
MSLETSHETADDYSVRRYKRGDRDGILSLFEKQWGDRLSAAWFDWKFVDDPYLSHVPITLAERNGKIVAVQGYIPSPVRWKNQIISALKPVDAVVHPDHRRQGLYSLITEAAINEYLDREPAFFFNFPNVASLGAQKKLGWSEIDVIPMYYRLQRPHEMLTTERVPAPLEQSLTVAARAYLSVRGRFSSKSSNFDVTRYSSVPGDLLESLYESHVPQRFHAYREAQYYHWVFDAPNYDHTIYVAHRDDRPVAALITRTESGQAVKIMETLPMTADHEAFADLLAAAVADNKAAGVITVSNRILPPKLLERFGFVSNQNPVLSRAGTPTYLAARPLWRDDESAPISPRTLTESENWRVSFLEVTD